MPILQCAVAALLVLVAMFVAIRFIRFAANLYIVILFMGACGFAVVSIARGDWLDWPTIVVFSLGTGFAAAILCIPVLPFSKYNRNN